jgi:hypothetical protein
VRWRAPAKRISVKHSKGASLPTPASRPTRPAWLEGRHCRGSSPKEVIAGGPRTDTAVAWPGSDLRKQDVVYVTMTHLGASSAGCSGADISIEALTLSSSTQ